MSNKDLQSGLSEACKEAIKALRRGGSLWMDRYTGKWLYSGPKRLTDEDASYLLDTGLIVNNIPGRLSDFYKLTELGKSITL